MWFALYTSAQQLQAYVAWVNAQLKKRPSVKPVQDLRQDLRDGVILAYLIEIVGQLALDSVSGRISIIVCRADLNYRTNTRNFASDFRNSSMDEEIENPYWSVRALVQQYEGQQRSPSESSCSSIQNAGTETITHSTLSAEKVWAAVISFFLNLDSHFYSPLSRDWRPGSPRTFLETSWEEQLLEQQEHLEKEMEEAKKMISGLQALLLNGSLPEDEQERPLALCEPGVNPEEQLIIIQSRLDQSMEENQDLKKELLKCKQDARNLQGIKDALQQRLSQQDTAVLQLKQELLRANMDKDELHNQNVDLQRKLDERNRLLGEYKKELGQKDRLLQQHQAKLEEALRKLSDASYQQVDPEREIERKEVLLAHCMKREADETSDLQLVRDALRSLRNSFGGHDPQHHTIDSLEQGISSLMERLHVMETQKKQERKVRGKSLRTQASSEYRESWPPNSKLPHSQSSPAVSSTCTKVLYFTDRSLTPFMVNIPKRLGEVTLKDFKAAIDREGNHRYHFKALDPEFGTVKEEVFHDDDAIPGWEGKIVAWVEEDLGEN
uniref:DIX domain containing 1 n=1 Tax=Jaculus jaculus TaxID=51337 RepID=A0A8C5K420_JACJA